MWYRERNPLVTFSFKRGIPKYGLKRHMNRTMKNGSGHVAANASYGLSPALGNPGKIIIAYSAISPFQVIVKVAEDSGI
jgi:hypothetical protein